VAASLLLWEGCTVPSAIALTYTILYWAPAQDCTFLEMYGHRRDTRVITIRIPPGILSVMIWFERLLAEFNFELWMGDAAKIAAKRVRKQKTDRLDAQHILHLLLKDDFPKIWVPSWENRDVRQLLWHRPRMVQTGTRIMNQLQAAALNEGLRYKKKL
jgi:hypothetical protein